MQYGRHQATNRGWLQEGESLLAPRLAWPSGHISPDVVHQFNRPARDRVIERMLDGTYQPCTAGSLFGTEPEAVLGETDRYGFPFRTVLGLETGMLRADPYYRENDLICFFRDEYRELNRGRACSHGWFFGEQVKRGQKVLDRVAALLPPHARVLDVGCGMGGMLVPFRFEGFCVVGCDYGEQYAARGHGMGLDIRLGGMEQVVAEGPFDLILLSHVIQHVTDPLFFCRTAASLLNPGGICYIELPGLLNLNQWYADDLLQYLQNANRWHFTAATLAALLRRAGMASVQCDERIECISHRASLDETAVPADGPRVLDEIRRLERAIASKAIAA
ncbi:MAG TPA: class I SAM-dependent methyltransferase [Tepidisphaeraceae bacterium]|jgi:2-polyprenyl-3-methyl-5-hydroxy-6-metoxy-1,4-benzoquinol methylase|nr:class I SAM-dependent methyltransferase [Tepidisphaeraceae bacterium]